MSDEWEGGERRQLVAVPRDEQKAILKEAFREAAKEWLTEQFAAFGRWSFYGLLSAGIVGILYFMLWVNGWHK